MSPSARRGRVVYEDFCIGCHGESGRGDGTASPYLNPLPRDLQAGRIKFKSTRYGAPPTRSDLLRTVTCGLPGSSMPGFPLLSEVQRRDVVEYAFHLLAYGMARAEAAYLVEDEGLSAADLVGERLEMLRTDVLDRIAREARSIPVPPAPASSPASVELGRGMFLTRCAACHGGGGAGDGNASHTLRDWRDGEAVPRDFTDGVFRAGSAPKDLYLRLRTGITGMPMPATPGTEEEIWALVHYIQSLRNPDAPEPKHVFGGCGGEETGR